MNVETVTDQLSDKLIAAPRYAFSERFFQTVLDAIQDWLMDVVDLPPKRTVLMATESALKRVFAGIDTPGPDLIIEPAIIQAVLVIVGQIYDRLTGDGEVTV